MDATTFSHEELIHELSRRWSGVVLGDLYKIVRCAGIGSYHALMEGTIGTTGERVAIKLPHGGARSDESFAPRSELMRERMALEELDGIALVPMYLAYARLKPELPALVMEWVSGSSLHQQLTLHKKLTRHDFLDIMTQIAAGLEELHERGFAYLNLAPKNVLTGGPCVRLIDFGKARHINEPRSLYVPDPRQEDVAQFGALMQHCLSYEGEAHLFRCGDRVSPLLDAMLMRCQSEDVTQRPLMRDITATLSRLLQLGHAHHTSQPMITSLDSSPQIRALDPNDFSRQKTRLRVEDSIELINRHEQITRPRVEAPPKLDAKSRAILRQRFQKHLATKDSD